MRVVPIIVFMMLLAATASWAQVAAPGGRELFQQGQFRAAYAALQPLAARGEPEALFLTLVIRRNGLDGRPVAAAGEIAPLWSALAAQSAALRRSVGDEILPEATLDVYRTALAQLEYFGPNLTAWPPGPPSPERAKRSDRAEGLLGPAVLRFGPALNFAAFLALEPENNQPRQAFQHSLRAAELGDHVAMGNVAWMYREGVGSGKDNLRAAHWARRSCDAAPPVSRGANEVGYAYESGRGVTGDLAEARAWYEKAAAGAHPTGTANLRRLKGKDAGAPVLDNRLYF